MKLDEQDRLLWLKPSRNDVVEILQGILVALFFLVGWVFLLAIL